MKTSEIAKKVLELSSFTEKDDVLEDLEELIEHLILSLGSDDVSHVLFEQVDTKIKPEDLAKVFDICVWSGTDNGKSLYESMERWLKSEDIFKVETVLNLDIPPLGKDEWEAELKSIVKKFPDLHCKYLN